MEIQCVWEHNGDDTLPHDEHTQNFLGKPTVEGSYGEMWSLRKVLRRFLWHDRIHAKAMYRMTQKTFGKSECNPFMFTSSTSTAT